MYYVRASPPEMYGMMYGVQTVGKTTFTDEGGEGFWHNAMRDNANLVSD